MAGSAASPRVSGSSRRVEQPTPLAGERLGVVVAGEGVPEPGIEERHAHGGFRGQPRGLW